MAQVTLQAVVNFEQVNQLQQRIDKLNGSKITIGVQDFTRQMKEAGTATGKVSESLSKVVRVFDANGGLVSGVEKYQKGIGTTVELMQKFNKETEELEQTGSRVIRDLAKEQKAAAKAAEEHAKYVAECNKEYAKYQQYVASMQKNTPIQNRIDALTGVYRDDPVTRKEFTDFGRLLFKQEEQAAKAAEKAAAAQKKEEEATAGANNEVKKQGLLYDVLGRSVSSFLARMVAYRAVYAGIRAITNGFREALETLKAVDDELVTVRKVTGFDSYQMARVEEQAYAVASKYGTSASDYTSSVAAFARAGYKDLSGDLAELAEKTKIVGDTTADVAQQFLLSVDAAYKYKGNIQALTAVLDGANEIDNKYATSIEKIAEGMGIVAPVAAQMNVDVDELAASIGTITAVTQRTGTEAARALRAIYLNIVGDTKTEIEEGVTWTTGEIEGLRDVVKLYAKDAWDAAQASGGIIDPMEAIAGLAKSVKDGVLTEAQLMEMVSDIGGKLRTSQLLALINNWDMYESMLNDYRNAYGSAEKEIENAMDSWSRKSEVLKNTWTQFVKTGLNSDAVKGFLDILIKIVQRLDSLPAVLTRIATIVVGMNLPAIGKSVSTFFSNIKNNGIASLDGLSAAITGVGIAWSVVSYIVEDAKRKHEEAVEKIYEQADAAKESTENILTLYADFNSAAEGSDALTESVKKLAEALGEDIPEGADAASKALAGFTLQSIQTTIEALNTAKVTAQEEFVSLANDIQALQPTQYDKYKSQLPDELKEFISQTYSSLPLQKGHGGAWFLEISDIDTAIQFRDAIQQIVEAFDSYIYKTNDASVLNSYYYRELQNYLLGTEEAYNKYLDAVNSLDEANLKKKFLELTSTIRVDSVDAYNDLIQRIGLYMLYTDDEREALIALAELYYPQYAKAIKDAEAATDDLTEAIDEENDSLFKNQEALEADATATERAAAAKKDAEASVHKFVDALFNEKGELTETGKAALTSSQYLADLANAELNARKEAAMANYANLRAQVVSVAKAALKAAAAFITFQKAASLADFAKKVAEIGSLLFQINQLENEIDGISVQADAVYPYTSSYSTGSSSGSKGSGGSTGSQKSTEDTKLASLQERIKLLKSELSLMQARGDSEADQISKMKEIQKAVEAERDYLVSIKGDQATINGLSEEWWNYQNKIADLQKEEEKDPDAEKLESLRSKISLLKSELSLMQARGDSEKDQIAKMKEIQAALEEERKFLVSIGGDQETINGLAEEWWNYQNKITDLQEQAADAAQKQADAVQAALEATIALANAEKQRSVRIYNASTGQWEWQADPSKVANARESYNSAMSGLSEEELALYGEAYASWLRSMARFNLAKNGGVGMLADFIQRGATSSNLSNLFNSIKNGSTYNMGGVTISEAQAKSMSVYDFAQLSGSLAAYNHSV